MVCRKNTDPLTNVGLFLGKLRLTPVLNYYLVLYCFELVDNIVIYHHSYGYLYDLLTLIYSY